MKRKTYRNGDDITLPGGCNGCNPSMISITSSNALTLCHETGCTEAWRDRPKECFECGCEFFHEYHFQRVCVDCSNPTDYDIEEED